MFMDTSLTWLGRLIESPMGPDWQRLVEVYTPLLSSWMCRAGVAESDRNDIVQEVLLVVVRRVSDFEHAHPGAFRGWLRTILANHLRSYYRRSFPRQCEFPLESLADPEDPMALLLDREHEEHIARQLMKIVKSDFSPTTWAAFSKQVLDGKSPTEVAAELNVSINVAIQSKFRVLKRLRQEFKGWFDQ